MINNIVEILSRKNQSKPKEEIIYNGEPVYMTSRYERELVKDEGFQYVQNKVDEQKTLVENLRNAREVLEDTEAPITNDKYFRDVIESYRKSDKLLALQEGLKGARSNMWPQEGDSPLYLVFANLKREAERHISYIKGRLGE